MTDEEIAGGKREPQITTISFDTAYIYFDLFISLGPALTVPVACNLAACLNQSKTRHFRGSLQHSGE